ncbi:MAG: Beta-monoglucosyldiacylglycerol synthase [Calditrichaeota bacterium]|nr:Beta-monoglucosyldiacylglycerol synthase [Calditrichota bacterium]
MLNGYKAVYGALTGLATLGLLRVNRRDPLPADDPSLPKVSVIVAARNEETYLPGLMAALSAQNYPREKIDFWIVDDHSEDNTLSLALDAARRDRRFHVISANPTLPIKSPKKRALYTAIRRCSGEWVVFTDADCVPGPQWIRALAAYMSDRAGIVLGYAPLTGPNNPLQWLAEGESYSSATLSAAAVGLGFPFNAFGRNFAARRRLYLDMGGFGSDGRYASGDDDLFLQRVAARTDWKVEFAASKESVVHAMLREHDDPVGIKARHMSVGPRYAPGWVLIGLIGSALYLGLGLATLLSVVRLLPASAVRGAWLFKTGCDVMLAAAGLRVLRDPKRALQALVTMSLAPFWGWIIWPKALFGKLSWKGRTIRRAQTIEPEPAADES